MLEKDKAKICLLAAFLAPGCDIPSSARVDCFGDQATPTQKVPFVTPELCIQNDCCYDDMYMREPDTWFYKPPGRTWCFKKQGAGTLHVLQLFLEWA